MRTLLRGATGAFLLAVWPALYLLGQAGSDSPISAGELAPDRECRIQWSDPEPIAPRLAFPSSLGQGSDGQGPWVYGWPNSTADAFRAGDADWTRIVVERPGESTPLPAEQGLAPQLSRGPDGTAWTQVTEIVEGERESLLARRSPDGSWTTEPLTSDLRGTYTRFAALRDGTLARIFVRAESNGGEMDANSLYLTLHGDEGEEGGYVTVLRGRDAPLVDPSFIQAEDGTLHVAAGRSTLESFANMAVHTHSRDGGRTWEEETVLVPAGDETVRRPLLLEDPRGGVHAFVGLLQPGSAHRGRYLHFRWEQGRWEGPEPAFGDVPLSLDAHLSSGAGGRVAAAWVGLPPDAADVEPGSEGWHEHLVTLFAEGRWVCPD